MMITGNASRHPSALVAGLALACALLSGCAEKMPASSLPPNLAEVVSIAERAGQAPAFSWRKPDGTEASFDGIRGKLTLVNFWATWCAPCRKELPALVELSREYADRGFRVVGIATDRTPNAAELVSGMIVQYSIPYQNVLSTQELEDAFSNIRMLPTSFLVDAEGRIVRSIAGSRSKAQFAELIAPYL